MTQCVKYPKPQPDYRCPLCPDHEDDVFVWSAILQTSICDGCDYDLWDLITFERRRTSSIVLDRLESLTDKGFDEYRLIELEHAVTCILTSPEGKEKLLEDCQYEIAMLKSKLEGK